MTLAEVVAQRAVIEQSKGMLMTVYGLSPEQAFRVLRWRSQETNTKLRDLVDASTALTPMDAHVRTSFDHLLLTIHQRRPRWPVCWAGGSGGRPSGLPTPAARIAMRCRARIGRSGSLADLRFRTVPTSNGRYGHRRRWDFSPGPGLCKQSPISGENSAISSSSTAKPPSRTAPRGREAHRGRSTGKPSPTVSPSCRPVLPPAHPPTPGRLRPAPPPLTHRANCPCRPDAPLR
ncbi:ANTAR domain-containing protein [Nocardia yunnanensis]|uniref:ANTAR domain-containing protein n=1 Tax=Nocardia yunnanensis TaxID=2382165 RepID=A0A386ZCE7_9NOCA|nr:ANTAR domain-containing protein [Nocardia yunnanensis]